LSSHADRLADSKSSDTMIRVDRYNSVLSPSLKLRVELCDGLGGPDSE